MTVPITRATRIRKVSAFQKRRDKLIKQRRKILSRNDEI